MYSSGDARLSRRVEASNEAAFRLDLRLAVAAVWGVTLLLMQAYVAMSGTLLLRGPEHSDLHHELYIDYTLAILGYIYIVYKM